MTPVSTSAAADAAAVAGAPPPPHPVRWDYNRGYLARPCPPDGARVRNRRYRRLQQLAEGGIWFSDEAMKERDPWLWFEYVGKRAKEEKPAPRRAVEEVSLAMTGQEGGAGAGGAGDDPIDLEGNGRSL